MRTARYLGGLALLVALASALAGGVAETEAAAPRALLARGPGIPYTIVLDDWPELLRLMNGLDPVAAAEVAALLDSPGGFDGDRLCCAGWEEELAARMSTPSVALTLCWRAEPGGAPDCEGEGVQRGALYLATSERPAWVLLGSVGGSPASVRLPSAEALAILERHGVPTRLEEGGAPSLPLAAAAVVALLAALLATRSAVASNRTNV